MFNFAKQCKRALGMAAGVSLLSITAAWATDVTVWCWAPEFNGAAMNEAIARYTASHPDVNITVVDFAKADLEQKLQTQLASGTTEGLPDIVLIEDYGAQKYLLSFPGAFEPLTDKVDYSKFADYKVALATVEGQTYSLPFDSGASGLFYRSDLLAEAGYDAAALQDITWDQMIEIGKAVQAKTGKPMFSIDQNDAGAIRIMLQSAGSWYFKEDGSSNVAGNPVFKAALETWVKMLQTPELYKQVSGWGDYTGAFNNGDVAGVFTGVWMVGGIKGNNMAGKWAVAPTPKLAGVEGAGHASNLGGSSWYVLSSAPAKDAAIDFLNTVWAGDVDFYQKILVGQGAFAAYLPAREGPAYTASDDYFGGQAVWADFSDWQAKIPGVNYGIFTNEADAAVTAALPGLVAGGSIDEAIAAIDAQIAQQIQ
jgi:lactose/L-arabinose transport system substrate-binding protein